MGAWCIQRGWVFPKSQKRGAGTHLQMLSTPRPAQLNKYLRLQTQKWPRTYIGAEASVVVPATERVRVVHAVGWSWMSLGGSCGEETSLSRGKGLRHVALPWAPRLRFGAGAACEPCPRRCSSSSYQGRGDFSPAGCRALCWVLASLCGAELWPQLDVGDGPALCGAPGG